MLTPEVMLPAPILSKMNQSPTLRECVAEVVTVVDAAAAPVRVEAALLAVARKVVAEGTAAT
jgi:hypothetical protein